MTQTHSNSVVDDYTKYILLDYRQKLLGILLVTCIIILLGLTIFNLIDRGRTTLIDLDGFDLVSAGIAIIVFFILLWMNQRGHVVLVGWIFCLIVLVTIIASYRTLDFTPALLILALPVAAASLVIQPWASFIF